MSAKLVILDHRRGEGDRLVAAIRREMIRANRKAELAVQVGVQTRALHARLVEGPAASLEEVALRAGFLLDRLSHGDDLSGHEIRTLIRRMLRDVVRLVDVGAKLPCD